MFFADDILLTEFHLLFVFIQYFSLSLVVNVVVIVIVVVTVVVIVKVKRLSAQR